ncbi:DUF961 family protein [Listeria welshimeri]|nr:DUF961 family protein [Listeria welshimeri]
MKFSEKNMIIDTARTFGRIGFIGYDGERFDSGDNEKVVNKRYGVSSDAQEGTVMIYLPATVDVDFPFDTEVKLVNPTINAFATATYNSTDIVTQVFADNIVPVSTSTNTKTMDKDLQKK